MTGSTARGYARTTEVVEKIAHWLVLNLCFVLTSLPGVTVVASAVALQSSLAERDDTVPTSRAYFRAFRSAWPNCWPVSVALPFVATAGVVSVLFYLASTPVVRIGALIILVPLASLMVAAYLAFLQVSVDTARDWRAWCRAVPGLLTARPIPAAAAVLLWATAVGLALRLPTLIPIGCGVVPALIARWAFGPARTPRAARTR